MNGLIDVTTLTSADTVLLRENIDKNNVINRVRFMLLLNLL